MRIWLMNIREKKKLSQSQLAKNIGVSRQAINSIEHGKRKPSVEIAKKIANELNFDWTDFYK